MNTIKQPLHGIFFDLGWTLLEPAGGDWMFPPFARLHFPKKALEALPQERVKAALSQAMHYLDTHHQVGDLETEEALFLHYYTSISTALPELGISPETLEAIAKDKVYNRENYSIFPDSIPTLQALAPKYRLGVISDTWPSIVPVLDTLGLLPFFHCTTYSFHLGVYKPHPALYQDALSKMGLPPEQTLFIDDFSGNLTGCEALGMQGALICKKPGAEEVPGRVILHQISDLLSLLELARNTE